MRIKSFYLQLLHCAGEVDVFSGSSVLIRINNYHDKKLKREGKMFKCEVAHYDILPQCWEKLSRKVRWLYTPERSVVETESVFSVTGTQKEDACTFSKLCLIYLHVVLQTPWHVSDVRGTPSYAGGGETEEEETVFAHRLYRTETGRFSWKPMIILRRLCCRHI